MESLDIFYTFAITILIVMSFVVPIRFMLAKHLGVDAKSELDKTNNAAFGVAIGGGVLGFILMLTGVMSGDQMAVISEEIMSLIVYGLLGSVLMIFGVLIQDKLVIRDISLSKEIGRGNMAAAFVVAANMAVVGLIAKKTITWIDSDGLDGILSIITVFALSQFILALVAFIRMAVYSMRNSKNNEKKISAAETWQGALSAGNTAVALRYVGQLVATGIVISVTSVVVDVDASLEAIAIRWGATSIFLTLTVWMGYRLFLPLILFRIDIVREVDHRGNLGVATIEAALLIGLAFMVSAYIV
ncbi:MAG: DUF350 domain-containing protein [Piscirickettsiaceae bacterium]|nr:DUF350 domain-containing protein [Piscirickettsiaceae bacterium]